jgi:hypothetical protein
MGRALGLLLIVVASGLFIYYFVMPLFVASAARTAPPAPPPATSPSPQVNPVSETTKATVSSAPPLARGAQDATAPAPDGALAAPRTSEQRAQDDLEAQRAPYYRWLREQAGNRLAEVALADDDRATLILYASVDSPDIVTSLMSDVILPAAYRYGFRHVRFYLPNPPGSVSQYRFDAESTADADGNWHTFHK